MRIGRNGTTRPRRAAKVRYWHLADVQTIASPGPDSGEKRTCLISVWMSAYDPSGPWSWGSFTYVVAAPMQRAPRLLAGATLRDHIVGAKDARLEQVAGDARADQRRNDEQPHLLERMRVLA